MFKKNILIILLFIIITSILTYPLIFKITTHIPGFFSSDEPYAVLWDSWRIKHSLLNKISLRHTPLVVYPFGVDSNPFAKYFSYLYLGVLYLLSILTTPILTYNLQVFFNLFLSGVFTFLLIFYLTENRLTAVFGGIIFAFCPYQFMKIWQHLGLTYNQWLPLVLFTTILLKDRFSKKGALIFFLSLLLLLSFDFSIMYLAMVMILSFFFYLFCYGLKIKLFKGREILREEFRYFKRAFIIILIAIAILLPQFLSIFKNILNPSLEVPSAFNSYRRPFEDLFSQSARSLSYLLPAAVHPIFGKFTERFIGSTLYGISFTEHTLYLGWIPLILAFIAFRRWKMRRKEIKKYTNLGTVPLGGSVNSSGGDSPPYREDFYIGFFIFLAVVAWFFSQPPWWKFGPIKIYMPSFFMYKILPMFRAYCRFGIVVMLAVAVLAGYGLKFILERFKTQKSKITITTLFCGLVLFEFWNYPPFKVIDVSKVPAVYYWLKEQLGDFAIAEYPLDADSTNVMYIFYQTKHEKKIINGTIPGTYANKVAQTIRKLSNPHTAGVLKWMNVKYILVHKEDYLKSELIEEIEELDKISNNPGLKFLKSFSPQECPRKDIMCIQKTGPIDIYEVIAMPEQPSIAYEK